MEETRWWSKLILALSVISIVLVVAAPLGYKFEAVALGPTFLSLIVGVLLAAIIVIAGIVMSVIAQKKGLLADRRNTLIALVVAIVPLIVMVPQVVGGGSVPPIHDITTDTGEPPTFNAVLPLRADAPNDVVYGQEGITAADMAKLTREAYPAVKTLVSDLTVAEALDRSETILREQGLVVVGRDSQRVEATATTFWFGFKDDVVVRVRPAGSGSQIDLRSLSRVGGSDLGTNAKRIEKFLAAF